jgi:gas vesicle protein
MSNDKGNLGKGLFLGFLAGGAIGAVIALLYAPKSGKELRSDIKLKADEYYDEAEKYVSEARDKAKDLINEGKKRSEKLITDARLKSESLLKDAEKVFNQAKTKAGDLVNTSKDVVDDETSRLKSAFKAGGDAYKDTKNQNNDQV